MSSGVVVTRMISPLDAACHHSGARATMGRRSNVRCKGTRRLAGRTGAAILNGALRELLLVPALGTSASYLLSGLLLSAFRRPRGHRARLLDVHRKHAASPGHGRTVAPARAHLSIRPRHRAGPLVDRNAGAVHLHRRKHLAAGSASGVLR